jgi:DNA topoisomerase-1
MLIIVESPTKAKTITKILNSTGSKHIVRASKGHIAKISENTKIKTPEGDKKLEINGIDTTNYEPIFEIDPAKQSIVKELKDLALQASDGILFATDMDREGESISWHLARVLGIPESEVQRLEFHEITDDAILEAMKNPRPLNMHLVKAQITRQVLDKLLGYKLSPVLWKVLKDYKLSAGRVQTPALNLVCKRELEIKNFQPEEYFEMLGVFEKVE